jgi:hypothetical protein
MNPITYNLPTKIRWKTDLSKTWQELFYPSVSKKISNAEARFAQVLELEDTALNADNFQNIFLPLYDKEIVSRPDYHLNRDQQVQRILDLLAQGKEYRFYAAYEKETHTFTGGYIYKVEGDMVWATFRVFNREITQKYKFNITADFWVEAHFLTHIKTFGKPFFTHGRDTHPRVGGIGLSLFKLKVGAKPYFPPEGEYELKSYPESEFITSSVPVFFFDEPNESNLYTHSNLYFNNQANMSVIREFQAIVDWAQIKLNLHESHV